MPNSPPAALQAPRRPGDFTTEPRVLWIAALAAVVGSGAVAAAWVLLRLITLFTNLAYTGRAITLSLPLRTPLPLWTVAVPVVGALIVGLMARYGSDKIRGHGIPEAIEAILIGGSKLSPRVALLKPLSSAISIGSGGPFGAEGPIIMTGGAIGSMVAQTLPVTAAERKTLLVAGAAAGMTAVFATPVAAVLLAIELLLFEWKPRSFIPVVAAVVVAAAERGLLLTPAPLFAYAGSMAPTLVAVLSWLGIGVLAGFASILLTTMVYAAEDAFAHLPLHWMWWPAIGGIVVGVGGLIEPAALGVGYDNIRHLLTGEMLANAVLLLLVVKAVIWAIALGSGTSGGVVAPLLITGSALGALVGTVLQPLIPGVPPGFFALLGMAATMGGTMRAPLTATLFAAELTHDMGALLPLLAACGAAYAVTVLLLRRSILTEKVARRGTPLSAEYHVDPYGLALVRDMMVADPDTLPDTMPAAEAIAFLTEDGLRHRAYPVVDADGLLRGLVDRGDLLRWTRAGQSPVTIGALLADRPTIIAHPDETALRLIDRMVTSGAGRVPVVDPATNRLVGLVSRRDLLAVRARADRAERERTSTLGLRLRRAS